MRRCVWPVCTHDVVQTRTGGFEPTPGLSVIVPRDQAHEFRHDVSVIPRWTEGIFLHQPAGREDDEIGNSRASAAGRPGEDGENGRVRVVEGNGTDRVEAAKVVFVWVVVTMPGYNVKRSVVLAGDEEGVIEFTQDMILRRYFLVFEEGRRGLEVSCVCEAIGADGAKFGELEMPFVQLTDVAPDRS